MYGVRYIGYRSDTEKEKEGEIWVGWHVWNCSYLNCAWFAFPYEAMELFTYSLPQERPVLTFTPLKTSQAWQNNSTTSSAWPLQRIFLTLTLYVMALLIYYGRSLWLSHWFSQNRPVANQTVKKCHLKYCASLVKYFLVRSKTKK